MKTFFWHLFIFLGGIVILLILNTLTGFDLLWFLWPAGVWSVLILLHATYAFVFTRAFVTERQEEKSTQVLAQETNVVEAAKETVAPELASK